MRQEIFTVLKNEPIADRTYRLILEGNCKEITASGQFVNIKIQGFFLRRPISVCDYSDKELTLIYKTVGKGTETLANIKTGEKLDLLTGLGNGYQTKTSGDAPLLIGGGAGVPPLYNLCKKLIALEKQPTVILGFNTQKEIFYEKEFSELGASVIVTTADGSYGTRGFVTDALDGIDYSYFYACGPEPMLKSVFHQTKTSGQFSFEERMGCGFGACMGCSCKTITGNKRICKEGPVLEKEEILWR